jgi:hypothetical protein
MRLKVKINGRLKDEKSPGSRLPDPLIIASPPHPAPRDPAPILPRRDRPCPCP